MVWKRTQGDMAPGGRNTQTRNPICKRAVVPFLGTRSLLFCEGSFVKHGSRPEDKGMPENRLDPAKGLKDVEKHEFGFW